MRSNIFYKEEQRYSPIFSILLILALLALYYGMYRQLFMGIPLGNNPMSDAGLIIFGVLVTAFVCMFISIKLSLKIKNDVIEVLFFPFTKKIIHLKDIAKADIIQYNMFNSGIRFSIKYGSVYRVHGNKGLFIELKNGSKILVGTKNEEQLKNVLNEITFVS